MSMAGASAASPWRYAALARTKGDNDPDRDRNDGHKRAAHAGILLAELRALAPAHRRDAGPGRARRKDMRKGITAAVLVSVLVGAPVLAATTPTTPEGATAPAKPGKPSAKKRTRRHGTSHGTKHPQAENTTTGTAK
jgi:hypothetical protein